MGIPGIVARQTQVGVEEWEKHMARRKQTYGLHTIKTKFFCMNLLVDIRMRQSNAPLHFLSVKWRGIIVLGNDSLI